MCVCVCPYTTTRHYVGVARLSLEHIDRPDDCSHAYPSPCMITNKLQHVCDGFWKYRTFIFVCIWFASLLPELILLWHWCSLTMFVVSLINWKLPIYMENNLGRSAEKLRKCSVHFKFSLNVVLFPFETNSLFFFILKLRFLLVNFLLDSLLVLLVVCLRCFVFSI